MLTGFWWGNPREGRHLEDPDIGRTTLKWIFKEWDGALTGFIWLSIWTGGRIL